MLEMKSYCVSALFTVRLSAFGWNLADFLTNENHTMRMVAHGQILVLGRRSHTPISWMLALAAIAYLQVTSDKLKVTS